MFTMSTMGVAMVAISMITPGPDMPFTVGTGMHAGPGAIHVGLAAEIAATR